MVYVHIAYCRSHCVYCGFYSELLPLRRGSEAFFVPEAYVDALCAEIEDSGQTEGRGPEDTLYFGGGTPSLLKPEQISRLMASIGGTFGEITLEVNPDDVVKGGKSYAVALKEAGVNRISMGVQSFDDVVLRRMGRRHSAAQAEEAFALLREAGFDNIGVDLIFGFVPDLDLEKISSTLLRLRPEHVSCYQLSVEEGSALERMVASGRYSMPSDEQCEGQYSALCGLLRGLGYEHYEISNWAVEGKRSRHNSAYWNHTPYLGLGPGAHSLIHASDGSWVRRWNNPDLPAYLAAALSGSFNAVRGSETLTGEQFDDERVMLGLRTAEGIDGKRIPEEKWFVADSIILNVLSEKH